MREVKGRWASVFTGNILKKAFTPLYHSKRGPLLVYFSPVRKVNLEEFSHFNAPIPLFFIQVDIDRASKSWTSYAYLSHPRRRIDIIHSVQAEHAASIKRL